MTKKPNNKKMVGQLMKETASRGGNAAEYHHADGAQQGNADAVELQTRHTPQGDAEIGDGEDDGDWGGVNLPLQDDLGADGGGLEHLQTRRGVRPPRRRRSHAGPEGLDGPVHFWKHPLINHAGLFQCAHLADPQAGDERGGVLRIAQQAGGRRS